MRALPRCFRWLCVLLLVVFAECGPLCQDARAAATTTGFAVDHPPADVGSDWFQLESLDLRGSARPALGLVGDFVYHPLVLSGGSDGGDVRVIQYQFFYHLDAGLVIADRLRLSASLPLLLPMSGGQGTLAEVDGVPDVAVASADGSGVGDLRLSADLRLAGQYAGPFTLALGARVFAATGQETHFTSDGVARFAGRLMGAGQLGVLSYAFEGGVLYHLERNNYAGLPFGTDLTFGAAAGLSLASGRVHLGPELFGSTVLSDGGDGFWKRRTTPLELDMGLKVGVSDSVRLGVAGGVGINDGLGAPRARALLSLEWMPAAEQAPAQPGTVLPPAQPDQDGDGVADDVDACPRQPGPAHPLDASRNGCPDPIDSDFDGIEDGADACPHQAGPPNSDLSKNGCPLADSDGDGIADPSDACPSVPGPTQPDPRRNGCPLDSDGDGITDALDACPQEAGPDNADPKRRGCPRASAQGDQIKLAEPIRFAPSNAQISSDSFALLDAIAEILLQHPELELVSVDGYTDGSGNARANLQLSRARAAAVVKWLVTRGVDAKRLTSRGFGSASPLESNDTEAGRKRNRRVEFHVLRRADTKPARGK
jgi:OOP family OmpA-OmpF porin